MTYRNPSAKTGIRLSAWFPLFWLLFPPFLQADDNASASAERQVRLAMEAKLNRELSDWSQRHGLALHQRQVRVDGTAGLASQPPCPTPLRVDPPADQALPLGRIQRQVSCPAEGWRYYIRARVSAVAELPVARHRLGRGHTIQASDLTLAKRELGVTSQDWVFARDALVGQSVRRAIRADKPIRHSQVTAPNWVSLGQEVLIEAAGGGFSAVMKGVALDAGSEGQPVRVRNLSSGQVITAYPVAPGKVQTRF